MATDVNPWSPEHWDPIAQSNYIRKYGMARAIARAFDAGTTVHGKPPAPAYNHAKHVKAVRGIVIRRNALRNQSTPLFINDVAMSLGYLQEDVADLLATEVDIVLSPGDISFGAAFRLGANSSPVAFGNVRLITPDDISLGVDAASSPSASIVVGSLALGVSEAATAYREQQLVAHPLLGVTEAPVVGNERQLVVNLNVGASANNDIQINVGPVAASASLGLAEAAALQLERDIVALPLLGFAESATVQLEKDLAAAVSLGLDSAALLSITEQDLTLSFDLGVAQAATVGILRNLVASMDLGIAEAAATYAEVNIAASEALGVSEAATAYREQQLVASVALGVDEAATARASIEPGTTTLGIDEAASVAIEAELVASAALGASEAATLQLEKDLVAAAGLGASATLPVYGLDLERANTINDIHVGFDANVGLEVDFNFPSISQALGVSEAATILREQYLSVPMDLGATVAAAFASAAIVNRSMAQNPQTSLVSGIGQTTFTHTGFDFSSAAPNRWMIAAIALGNSGATINSVTIGGVPAIQMSGAQAGTISEATVWVANVASGTSGNVVINCTSDNGGTFVTLYVVDGDIDTSSAEAVSEPATAASFPSQNLSVKRGGFVIGIIQSNNGSQTWAAGSPTINTDVNKGAVWTGGGKWTVRSGDGTFFPADTTWGTGTAATLTGTPSSYALFTSLRPDLNPPIKINSTNLSLGVTEAVAVSTVLETVFSASEALGISEAAALALQLNITNSPALGFSEAATITTNPTNQIVTTFIGSVIPNANVSPQTFSGFNIGSGTANTWVVAALHYGTAGARLTSGVKIGGVTATMAVRGSVVAGRISELWYANVPAGGTVSVVATYGGANNGSCAVWKLEGPLDTAHITTDAQGASTSYSTTLTSKNGACGIAACTTSSGNTITFNEPTSQDYQANETLATTYRIGGAHRDITTATWSPNMAVAAGSTTNYVTAVFPPV